MEWDWLHDLFTQTLLPSSLLSLALNFNTPTSYRPNPSLIDTKNPPITVLNCNVKIFAAQRELLGLLTPWNPQSLKIRYYAQRQWGGDEPAFRSWHLFPSESRLNQRRSCLYRISLLSMKEVSIKDFDAAMLHVEAPQLDEISMTVTARIFRSLENIFRRLRFTRHILSSSIFFEFDDGDDIRVFGELLDRVENLTSLELTISFFPSEEEDLKSWSDSFLRPLMDISKCRYLTKLRVGWQYDRRLFVDGYDRNDLKLVLFETGLQRIASVRAERNSGCSQLRFEIEVPGGFGELQWTSEVEAGAV